GLDGADCGDEPAGHRVVGLQGRSQSDPCGAFVLGERSDRDHARLPSVCQTGARAPPERTGAPLTNVGQEPYSEGEADSSLIWRPSRTGPRATLYALSRHLTVPREEAPRSDCSGRSAPTPATTCGATCPPTSRSTRSAPAAA